MRSQITPTTMPTLALVALLFGAANACSAQPFIPGYKKPVFTAAEEAKKPASFEAQLAHAERIAKLRGFIQKDQETRDKLKSHQSRLDDDVKKVSQEAAGASDKIGELRALLDKLGKEGNAAEIDKVQADIDELGQQKFLANEQLDLTLQERKLVQDRIASLDQKLLQGQLTLELLMNAPEDGAAAAGKNAGGKANPDVQKAQAEADVKEASAKDAEAEFKSLDQRIKSVERFLELEKGLLETDRKKLNLAAQQKKAVLADMEKANGGDAGVDKQKLWEKRAQLEAQLEDIAARMRERTERMNRLQADLTAMRHEQAMAQRNAEARKQESGRAQAELDRLQNPLNPHNMLRWGLTHGPKIGLILAAMFALRIVIRSADKRLVDFMVSRSQKGRAEERENSARTLVAVFHNAATVAMLCGGGLMLLEECGVPIVPLMGGAAILGLAAAFGAQSLIKDYFCGFVILLENQYAINDVIRVNGTSGMVERITLRMTALRDLEGVLHFIPHGQAGAVSNLTHGWSRVMFEISVSYSENVDSVMEVLMNLGRELHREPAFADLILEDPEMLGVDRFLDAAVVIKFLIKTRPLKQWHVKREMMRRIKIAFDREDIDIPVPRRVVHHKYDKDQPPAPAAAADTEAAPDQAAAA